MNQFNAKERALRSKVRNQLGELIRKRNEMQAGGADKSEVEEISGQIEVLKKELQSVEDGGHTVFMSARQMLGPKTELSKKEKKINWKKRHIEIRIKSLRKDLASMESSPEEKEDINKKLSKFEKELADLNQEMRAVEDFNHTRFMDSQKSQGQENVQEEKLREVERQILEMEAEINGESDQDKLLELKDRLHFLELEKEAIENFTHDEFLQNLQAMKAKRRSQRH